jgi:hypothetical protein
MLTHVEKDEYWHTKKKTLKNGKDPLHFSKEVEASITDVLSA